QIWEACQAANHQKLDRLILFVDWNKKQLDGWVENINETVGIEDKFKAFGFEAQTVAGYDVEQIYYVVENAKRVGNKPHVIVLDTIKGLGVSFAERMDFNHYMVIDEKMAAESIAEIEKRYAEGTYPAGGFTW
ncbi:MAG: transketolase, partial [Clostridia bacterium]|nr:transketolase [Clostridia bacterium]